MTQPVLAGSAVAGGGWAGYREVSVEPPVAPAPLAHLSVEFGHLYAEDFAAGPEALRQRFQQVAPWAAVTREAAGAGVPYEKSPRVSTCVLVDDYSVPIGPPATVIPEVLAAARENGLDIDYVVRESGCVEAGGVELARLVEARIVPDPPPGTTGARPLPAETGWLCNGERSPGTVGVQAMEPRTRWRPPAQTAARNHSVFVDVELWDEQRGVRTWSYALLAAVWQLLRLGLLRSDGGGVADPGPLPDDLPTEWDQLPTVTQLNVDAAPFSAYRTLSVLPARLLTREQAVRTILSQVAVEAAAAGQVLDRAVSEGIALPLEPVERIQYVFLGEDPAETAGRSAPG